MPAGPLGAQTIVVWHAPSTQDAYGNMVLDWRSAVPTTVEGCSVQPLTGDEQQPTGRDALTVALLLLAPAHSLIEGVDRIEHGRDTYEVDGPVERWPDPAGGTSHLQCRLRLVEG